VASEGCRARVITDGGCARTKTQAPLLRTGQIFIAHPTQFPSFLLGEPATAAISICALASQGDRNSVRLVRCRSRDKLGTVSANAPSEEPRRDVGRAFELDTVQNWPRRAPLAISRSGVLRATFGLPNKPRSPTRRLVTTIPHSSLKPAGTIPIR
jgi:hypothetical protein